MDACPLVANDYVSKPDLYVTLRLPTASACTLRTRTINNSQTPDWNETFHFRAYSQAKNILEITLYDSDIALDDKCTSILFDISTLKLGQKLTKDFITDDKVNDKLWVEFELTESPGAPGQYLSNGVLLAAPLSTLEVKLDKLPIDIQHDMLLKLQGAYNEDQVISMSINSSLMQTLRYFINKDLESKFELQTLNEDTVDNEKSSEVSVTPFGPTQDCTLTLPVAKENVNLHLNTVDSSDENMKVRLDFDIPPEEKVFLVKRREVVSRALQKFLSLESSLDSTQVPTVALVCSGGSSRAMTGMYGALKGLQSLGLLDAITYITSVSGSTWALASLYSDPFWSKEGLDKVMASSQKELSKSVTSLFSPAQLSYYHSELQKREKEGYSVSLIDTWGLVLEHLIFGKKHTETLSDQKKAVYKGQNPLPIYTAVNMKKDTSGCLVPEWCEFTPYEVGFSKYGAFISAENFGSEFYLGHVVKKLPETRISFLLGMWSSIFSANLMQLWSAFTGMIPSWASRLGDKVDKIEKGNTSSTLNTLRVNPEASVLSGFLNGCPIISNVFNFLRGFTLHNLYSESSGFNTSNETHPDAFPNKLTPADSTLGLVDSGFAINTAFSPVLRPQRHADIILSLDYTWVEDHLKTLKDTQQYCSEHKLPFPKTDFSKYKSEPKREVYVFEDENNPDAPIVLHFPLVNVSFKEFKAPGVKRKGNTELIDGNIDVSSSSSPYATKNITFESRDFQKLVDLTSYNIVNNKEIIRNTLKKAMSKKGLANIPSSESVNNCTLA
ncbi:cytosolic phospholipase A2 zeta-like isoform X2 [Silurus meridionalis]|nr:cytosolic phospholipase A2 zeta-like isoform X2 [Silurus meridionalis]